MAPLCTITENGEISMAHPHPDTLCEGNCKFHPLLFGPVLEMHKGLRDGKSWGDFAELDFAALRARETDAERAKREQEEARQKELNSVATTAYEQKQYAERMAIKARMGVKKHENSKKLCKPCKWAVGADPNGCVECWAHEHADPKSKFLLDPTTGKATDMGAREGVPAALYQGKAKVVKGKDGKFTLWRTPHTCIYLHPGEDGWLNEWYTNPRYDPSASATQNRFGALKGGRF